MTEFSTDEEIAGRLRDWLQTEAETAGPPPGQLRERITAIPAAPLPRVPLRIPLGSLSSVAAVMVTVVVAVALTVLGVGVVRLPSASGPNEATLGDLDVAVEAAFAALKQSDAVEGLQLGHINEYLAGAVWFDYRPNGDAAVVQRADVDVRESGWWLNPAGDPPATGRHVVSTLWVLVGDSFFEAKLTNGRAHNGWTMVGRDQAPTGSLALGISLLEGADHRFEFGAEGGAVTRSEGSDGREIWTLTSPYLDGEAVQTWEVSMDGVLESWSYEIAGASPVELGGDPTTSASIQFTPIMDPDPIGPPLAGSEPDVGDFALPEDLPLGS